MNDMNIDKNTLDNIKNMVDNGNITDAISQISPEMIQNFSKMFAAQNNQNSNTNNDNSNNENTYNNQNNYNNNNSNINNNSTGGNENQTNFNNSNFDFSNIDMNTIMKMSSMLGKMNNNKNDPRANLLNSLKPYLRDSKKGKLDNYMNLLNVSKIADIMKNNNNNNNQN